MSGNVSPSSAVNCVYRFFNKCEVDLIYLHCYIVIDVGATLSEVVVHISLASMFSVRVRGQRIDRVDNTSARTSAIKRDSRKTKKDDVDS